MQLILVRGIPGSGKSTFAKKNFQCCILENDQMQIKNGKYCWSPEGTKIAIRTVRFLAEGILGIGADVCVCNTFTKTKYIEAYKKMADACGASFKVYRCVGNYKNVHDVPDEVMKSMRDGFEDWPGEIVV